MIYNHVFLAGIILFDSILGELITATPAVFDDNICIRTDNALYAFGK